MSEAAEQKKILNYLKSNNFWVFKTIQCNRSGIMDIIGCTPSGRFLGIEVKFGTNKATALQRYNIEEVQKRNGYAFVAWSVEDVVKAVRNYNII